MQNPDCPCGTECVPLSDGQTLTGGAKGKCDLKVTPTFTCNQDTKKCTLLKNPECPPQTGTCTVKGYTGNNFLGQNANYCSVAFGGKGGTNSYVLADKTKVTGYPATHPCTGCHIGQTCEPLNDLGVGSCTGLPRQVVAIKVDFIAEGKVVSLSEGGNAHVQWERVQCVHPIALQPQGLPGYQQTQYADDYFSCPKFHQGCVAWATHSSDKMKQWIFGDGVAQKNPTYEEIDPSYSELEFQTAPLWPLSFQIPGGANYGEKYMLANSQGLITPIASYTIDETAAGTVKLQNLGCS